MNIYLTIDLQNVQRLFIIVDLFCSPEMLFIISEVFVDDADCDNASSIMLLFAKKWSSCIANGDSTVIINTNPMDITAKIYL